MTRTKPGPKPAGKPGSASVFTAPFVIGVASLAGLIVALVGDGLMDVLSWIGLALPIAAIGWALAFRRT